MSDVIINECPYCLSPHDRATCPYMPAARPQADCFNVCIHCLRVSRYDEKLNLRTLSEDEQIEASECKHVQRVIALLRESQRARIIVAAVFKK